MQPKSQNKLIGWCIVTNMAIIVGAGHGIGFLILIEVIMPNLSQSGDYALTFNLRHVYDQLLPAVALLSGLGQLCLLISLFFKLEIKRRLAFWGLSLAYLGLFYLTSNMLRGDSASAIGFMTSIPFLILSGILIKKFTEKQEYEAQEME